MNSDYIKKRLDGADKVWNRLDYTRDGIIEASAGTGKTYTLQSIVLKLLTDGIVDSVKNILLVTFTEKAAGELRDRIRQILLDAGCLPDDFDEVNICTIHSFCRELLSEYAFENGVPMKTDVAGSDDDLIHRAVLTSLMSAEYKSRVGENFSDLMSDAGVASAADLAWKVKKCFRKPPLEIPVSKSGRITKDVKKGSALAKLVNPLVELSRTEYDKLKTESSRMTFDDMVLEARRVIDEEKKKDDSGLLRSIREKYRIALVDEFQDTDANQWDIFSAIFSCRANNVGADAPRPQHGFLLVVGDPKQAIYSFRGADVGTYLEARNRVTDTGDGGQVLKSLDTTFRSSPELVRAFNVMFRNRGECGWFYGMTAGSGSITYEKDVNEPPDSTPNFHGFSPCEGFGTAVTLLESLAEKPENPATWQAGYGNRETCLSVFMRNTAAEMKRLNGLAPAYRTADVDTGAVIDRRFDYRDMCVLVRGKSEAETVKRILAEYGIPCAFYKEQGLFDSVEAESLLAIFDYLADPGSKGRLEAVLLSPFCDVPPARLAARLASGDPKLTSLTEKWKSLEAKRNWTRLFDSFLTDTCLAHPVAGDFGYDRLRAAVRQILDKLLASRGASARSVSEFSEELRSWRKGDQKAEENGALREKESAADCVQVMTMHVSKGLEFKVVFVAYGFGKMASLAEEDEKVAAMQEERRLLYVALTRAEYKLYLPWSEWAKHVRVSGSKGEKEEIGIGSVGSALLIQDDKSGDKGFLGRGILALYGDADKAAKAVEGEHRPVPPARGSSGPAVGTGMPGAASAEIPEYGIPGNLRHLKLQWDSYTTIERHSGIKVQPMTDPGHGDHLENPPQPGEKLAETLLPRSNISGDVFHEIMETLCGNDDSEAAPGFMAVGRESLADLQASFSRKFETPFVQLIRRKMRKFSVRNREGNGDSTERTLARMVWNVLNTPVTIGNTTFLLRDINADNRRAEMEFVMKEESLLGAALPKMNGYMRDGLFNGKIDLLVRPDGPDGRVFVIDWKTNSLGAFDDRSVAAKMVSAGYVLQYRLYSLAVNHWLGEGRLGGIAYLFVRGGEPEGGKSGVYTRPVTDNFIAECREAVAAALSANVDGEEMGDTEDGSK